MTLITTSTVPPTTVPPSTVPASVPPVHHPTRKGSPAPRTHPPVTTAPKTAVKTEQYSLGGWNTSEASWYGPGFYGHHTACGQTYTRGLRGVAHKSYPCGTMVTFEYKGRVVSAPVIDRGPYTSGRTWDLSEELCHELGHCFTDSIHWRLSG